MNKKRLTVVSIKPLLNSKLTFCNDCITINHVYLNYLFNYWVLEVREIYKNINRCNKHDFRRVCKVYLLDQNLR